MVRIGPILYLDTSVNNLKKLAAITFLTLSLYLTENGYAQFNVEEQVDNSVRDTGGIYCGQVIHTNITLTVNLICAGDGLIVGEDGITVNLDGHSVEGPSKNSGKVGIAIPHSNNVTIHGPGIIRYFQAGILITGSIDAEIKNIKFEENKIGIFMVGSIETIVDKNDIRSNTIGVASHTSRGNNIHANVLITNDLAGVTFKGTDNSRIDANSIHGSEYGIFLDEDGSQNTILNNTAMKNDIDINNADGLAVSENGNEFNNNKCNTSDPDGLCK